MVHITNICSKLFCLHQCTNHNHHHNKNNDNNDELYYHQQNGQQELNNQNNNHHHQRHCHCNKMIINNNININNMNHKSLKNIIKDNNNGHISNMIIRQQQRHQRLQQLIDQSSSSTTTASPSTSSIESSASASTASVSSFNEIKINQKQYSNVRNYLQFLNNHLLIRNRNSNDNSDECLMNCSYSNCSDSNSNDRHHQGPQPKNDPNCDTTNRLMINNHSMIEMKQPKQLEQQQQPSSSLIIQPTNKSNYDHHHHLQQQQQRLQHQQLEQLQQQQQSSLIIHHHPQRHKHSSLPFIFCSKCKCNCYQSNNNDNNNNYNNHRNILIKTVQGEIKIQAENGETRILRSAPDWTESAILGDHIWVSTSTSGSDLCYVGENKCTKIGPRLCCPACKVTAHTGCMSILLDNMKFQCKPTFKDGVRQYREQTYVKHHWVHRRHEKGRCKHCGKSFQSKLSFGNKEIVAVSCSWCKSSYHNREPCFTKTMLENNCDFGIYQRFIVPSSWIVKLPRKGSFKSSIRRTPRNKRLSSKKRSSIKQQQAQQQLQSTNKAPNTTTTATTNTDQHSSTNSSQQSLINDNNHHRNTNNSNVLLQISPTSIVIDDFYPPLKSAPPPSPPPPTTTTTTPLSMNNNSSSSAKQSLPNQSSTISTTSSTTSPQPPTPATTVMSESLDNDNNTMSSSIQLSPSSNSNFESISNSTNNWCLIGDNNNGDDNLVVVDGGDYNNNEQSIIDKNKSIDLDSNDTDKLDDKTLETLKQITNAINNRTTASSTTAAETAAAAPPIVYTSVATNRAPKHRRHSHANVMPTQPLNSSGGVNSNDKSSNNAPHSSVQVVNNRVEQYLQHVHRSFVIKPIPSANLRPLLVFINPKSGGNQGAKLMQKFQWHLNPRQVFDLSQGGPRLGLDLYKKVHNLRILACGGDGTAGWVLSAIDEIAIQPPPPISVLPLGTGNDLARSFGWGGSYTDEPIAKILCNILEGQVVQLDRWNLKVSPNYQCIQQQQQQQQKQQSSTILDDNKDGKQELPLNVVNNYFSIGVDAHIALSFHEAREAHPERFNSRLRNKMFYGQAGGKDLLQRKWKDLCNYVNLECDGKDFTNRLKELKVHSVLFLNIPSYGGGTRPWPTSSAPSNLQQPKTDDGYIEVIGLTTYQLPLLQAGGHGTIITQCRQAKIVTSRTIPMQVDGEPCRLLPSLINLELRNKVNVVANTKTFEHKRQMPALQKITLKIRKLNLNDYETYHYDKDKLKEISTLLGSITIDQVMELSNVRIRINEMMKEKGLRRPSSDLSSITTTTSTTSNQSSSLIDSQSKPLPICYENVTSSTTSTEPRPLQSQSSITNSSVSIASKFVSNDWCFVDSVTAERFFRIDRAQEELYYVVDICHDDLFILDPQFDEKDDLDLFTSEEVIAKVVADVSAAQSAAAAAASASFHNDSTNADNELQQQQTNQNNSIKNQNQNKSTELNYNNQNNNEMMNNLTNNTTNDVKSSKKMMPQSLNLNNYINNNSNNNHNHNNNNSSNNNSNIPNDSSANMEPYYRQMCKLDNNNTLRLQSNQFDSNVDDDHQDSSHDNSSNANDNSLIQPKSPLRKHKMLSSLSPMKSSQQQEQSRSNRRKLQNQLMLAARNGDISLLKHLHHKGLNLMLVDDKGMSALHYAVMYNQEEAVAFLSNAFTKEMLDLVEPEHGHTALHKAIIGDKRNICLTLVLRGARLDLCDNSGQTIEQLGRNLGHHDLLKTLLHVSQACNRETAV